MTQEKCIPFLCKDRNTEIRESKRAFRSPVDCGYANGYVAVPKSHPWYGRHYSEFEEIVNIHGGLTFSGQLKGASVIMIDESTLPEDYWAFGFDTIHHGDTINSCNESFCISETLRLKKQLEDIKD